MDAQKINDFFSLFNDVFDQSGNVKACGRNACKRLIFFCKSLDQKTYYGSEDTGMMCVENILALKEKLS